MHEGCISNLIETILFSISRTLLIQLRKQICNKKEKKVCCRSEQPTNKPTNSPSIGPNNSSSPSYLPDPLKGECGISGTAEFVLGLTGTVLKKLNS